MLNPYVWRLYLNGPGRKTVAFFKKNLSIAFTKDYADGIWRSVSTSFNDPYFYYYRCAYIAQPKIIPRFSLQAMRRDPIFSKPSIVRKNMRGINGVELPPSVYNH